MCHHLVDTGEEPYAADEAERDPESVDDWLLDAEETAVDVELDREYDEGEVKTPGDD